MGGIWAHVLILSHAQHATPWVTSESLPEASCCCTNNTLQSVSHKMYAFSALKWKKECKKSLETQQEEYSSNFQRQNSPVECIFTCGQLCKRWNFLLRTGGWFYSVSTQHWTRVPQPPDNCSATTGRVFRNAGQLFRRLSKQN